MEDQQAVKQENSFVRFMKSPLRGRYPKPMESPGDWLVAGGVVLFAISVFALPWMTLGIRTQAMELFGFDIPEKTIYTHGYGLFVSPWAWAMLAILVAVLGGMWFVQTQGGIALGAGIYCIAFNVIFFIGVWKKINGIIGDIVSLAKSVPIFGDLLGKILTELTKNLLDVHVAVGYYLFIPAGLLLIAGGVWRLVQGLRTGGAPEIESPE